MVNSLLTVATGERRNIFAGGVSPRYAASGHLIYAQGANLTAVSFDPQRLRVTGTAVPMEEGVLQAAGDRASQYSISATGSLAYVPGGAEAIAERLVWVSRNGTEQSLAAALHTYVAPRLSPDGQRVAVTVAEQGNQIWLYDITRDALTRLTFEGTANQPPVWTPDGKRIAFYSNEERAQNLAWQRADGSGGLERMPTSEYTHVPSSFSRDGQLLAFAEVNPTTGFDIWVLTLSDHQAKPFLRTPFNEAMPIFSPDGRWMAYISDESGRYEVYVQPYPGPGGKYQISTGGGTEPVWNRNGKELFYRSGDKMMVAEVEAQPSFSVSKPRMLFEGPYVAATITTPNYDVSPDGQRFLMIKPSEQSGAMTQIVVVQNWFEELKQKVPTGKK
jgi:eukaryotic-like serine/threonine-protein kinase